MKTSYNWLKELVDIKVSVQKLAEDLTLFGHEVEEIKKKGNDFILDIKLTPNRGDCLSILGIAREIAALYNTKINTSLFTVQIKEKQLLKKINIKISDPEICPRFTARIIDNIKIDESPNWLKNKLKTYGFRPINNIVDITNYIMIEIGQPLHAFDYNKIYEGRMNIRRARKNESIITLDGKNRLLDDNAIIIEDGKKIYDLAGIMGGFNSEIDNRTKTIILLAAVYNPTLIRRTSKLLNLVTDASYRFERNIDWKGTVLAINKATDLINKTSPKSIDGKLIDIIKTRITEKKIKIELTKIGNLLGLIINQKKISNYLIRLGFKKNKNQYIVPSYRVHEINNWRDLSEEIIRFYGLNKLKHQRIKKTKSHKNKEFFEKENIKDVLVANGFTEIYSYSFADKNLIVKLGFKTKDCVKIKNGISPETEYLRPNLILSTLSAISKNPWAPEINIFEIGKVFSQKFNEKWQLAIATTDKRLIHFKNVLEQIGVNSKIKQIDQKILDLKKIRKKISYIVIDLNKIKIKTKAYNEVASNLKYQKISDYPPTIRDLAFIVNKKISSIDIKDYILHLDVNILLVELFDEYESIKIGEAKKSVAFHIWLQDLKKPIGETTAQNIINKIIKKLNIKFRAKLRS